MPGLFSNAYGAFDPDTSSFRVTDPLTPRPWVNVMSNDRYGLVVSQSGAGFSWLDNCQLFRLTRWEQDLVRNDYGRWLYLQDLDEPSEIWSASYQPTRIRTEVDEVEHGLGYSTFTREHRGVRSEWSIHVPENLDAEVWLLALTNRDDRARHIRLASFVEWQLGPVGDWHREFHRLFMESRVEGGALLAWKHAGLPEHQRAELEEPIRAVCAWKGGDANWMTDKLAFFGREGSASRPEALLAPDLPARSVRSRWDDPVAAGVLTVVLDPGERIELAMVLGAARGEEVALTLGQSLGVEAAKSSLLGTQAYWRRRCERLGAGTGDAAIDRMSATWLPYQAIGGRLYARCAYYQQGGAYGFRDQLQDSLMLLDSEPETTLEQLRRHASVMYEDGGVKHWWHPSTGEGPESWHSDTSLWLAYGALEYLEATGDVGAMGVRVPYLRRERDVAWVAEVSTPKPLPHRHEPSDGEGELWDHCLRGIQRFLRLRSPRGLPLIGAGDWNDGLSHAGLDGRGESVWLAMFGYDILNRWQPWLQQMGLNREAETFAQEARSLQRAVEEHAWDGDWYLAGTRDDGQPFGSRVNDEGRIFLNPQTWAVLSGIAAPERAARALESVRRHLLTPYGALLLQPAYSRVDPYIGYITRYAPGLRENGGVYSHASCWAVAAFAKAGDMETARAIYRSMLPCLRAEQDADAYAAEPYVMPGNVDGPDSPYPGKGGWTWYTGSAAWMVRVAKLLTR